MNVKSHAVLVGINSYEDERYLPALQYAEKDCLDLFQVLTNPDIGNIPQENVHVLLGKDATTRRVESLLHSVVARRASHDMVIVHFSGHGFLTGDPPEAYLATSDVSTTELLKNPNAGLRMSYLHEDIFLKSNANQIVFVLDCCHSGALVPAHVRAAGPKSPSRGLLDARYYTKGRVAICSCPPDATSRESDALKNGVFSHYIVKGLQGAAAERDTGHVTLDSLITYVRIHTPPDQPPGRYGHDFGRIVLTKPKQRPSAFPIHVPEAVHPAMEATPLNNPLEPYAIFIRELVTSLFEREIAGSEEVDRQVLEAVRSAAKADVVFLLRHEKDGWIIKSQSSFGSEQASPDGYTDTVVARILPNILNRSLFGGVRHGVYYTFKDQVGRESAVVVTQPDADTANELIFVCGLSHDSHLVGDAFGRILAGLYSASRGLTTIQSVHLEAAILDDLKRAYRFVPASVYERRFELFQSRLRHMIVHFQPVLRLGPGAMEIESWEALARDPVAMTSPTDLFDAAELWGRQFMIELDIHFVKMATQSYRSANTRLKRRGEDIKGLSVNVYPESLMRTAYYRAVEDIITKDRTLPARKLTLEISEKTPLPPPERGDGPGRKVATFKERLGRFARDLEVGFAIDDFGVGYASSSRLAGLNPAYVKIDRDVLVNDFGELTIQYVMAIANQGLRPQQVVIEGFDESSRISLQALVQLGVRRVQGFLIGRPGPKIYGLDRNLQKYLSKLIES